MINSYPLPDVEFDGNCLINNIFVFRKVINVYISYTLDTWTRDLNTDFTLGNCLLGAVKLTKNTDPGKYGYSAYGIGFNARSQFLWTDGSWGKNVVIFGADTSLCVHVDNKKKLSSSW